jgi:uncharacterized coiled-coil protein SlyX
MKITRNHLKRIIKEELSKTLNEQDTRVELNSKALDGLAQHLEDFTSAPQWESYSVSKKLEKLETFKKSLEILGAEDVISAVDLRIEKLEKPGRDEQEQSHSDFLEEYVNNMLEKGYARVDTMPVGPGPDMLPPGPVQYRISGYGTSAWTNPADGTPEDAGWYVVSTGGIRGRATEDRIAILDSPESPMTKVGDDWFHGKIYAILKK